MAFSMIKQKAPRYPQPLLFFCRGQQNYRYKLRSAPIFFRQIIFPASLLQPFAFKSTFLSVFRIGSSFIHSLYLTIKL